jgi:hypothetical protein
VQLEVLLAGKQKRNEVIEIDPARREQERVWAMEGTKINPRTHQDPTGPRYDRPSPPDQDRYRNREEILGALENSCHNLEVRRGERGELDWPVVS